MIYTKENAGHFSLENIIKWFNQDNEQPTIAGELKKYGGGSIARHNPEELDRLMYRDDEMGKDEFYER